MPKRSTVLIAVLVAAIGCAGCGGSSGNSGRDAGLPRLDGVYGRTQSAAAVARHDHVPVSQALAENYGDFVLVIRGGEFALTQRNAHACTWQYGTIHAHRDRVDWLFTDGGGEAPNKAENKPGEHFVWKASYFRDVLTLVPVMPSDLMAATWRRVSSTPTRSALAHQCLPPMKALSG